MPSSTSYQPSDIHVHVQPWRMVKPGALALLRDTHQDPEQIQRMMDDPEAFLAYLDQEGIARAALINYISPEVMGFTDEVNDFVSAYARRAPDRLLPFGSVHPRLSRNPGPAMDSLIQDLGVRGIKLHPPHQLFFPNEYRHGLRELEAIYQKAQTYRVPVMIHTGTSIFPGARNIYADPIYLDDVAVDFPELTLIMAHGGRPLWMETAFFLVRRHPNIYLDISGIPPRRLLEYFPRLESIAEKVLWGSDWPGPGVPGLRANVEQFLALPLSEKTRRLILRENALKLFPYPH